MVKGRFTLPPEQIVHACEKEKEALEGNGKQKHPETLKLHLLEALEKEKLRDADSVKSFLSEITHSRTHSALVKDSRAILHFIE